MELRRQKFGGSETILTGVQTERKPRLEFRKEGKMSRRVQARLFHM